jgi:hypothetical protein
MDLSKHLEKFVSKHENYENFIKTQKEEIKIFKNQFLRESQETQKSSHIKSSKTKIKNEVLILSNEIKQFETQNQLLNNQTKSSIENQISNISKEVKIFIQ